MDRATGGILVFLYFIFLFSYSFIYLFIYLVTYLLIYAFILFINKFIDIFIYSSINLFIYSFIHFYFDVYLYFYIHVFQFYSSPSHLTIIVSLWTVDWVKSCFLWNESFKYYSIAYHAEEIFWIRILLIWAKGLSGNHCK